ncbi:NERD domain-containing protein [Candidatus Parcubacteria bacterium]|nr:NERD domain-containing protein [Patescibacteria group bacterium]MBU4309865.1 NERD domain-containing protein [Patescibacteria group bacterium]MBU4431724.1 NERD domain-containing protein [Patescibacteria group bacterium]MBU4578204.1 NERD domain-containing protein [Patescibacteria group bacterium]MCG2696740.1 NERD domain-containing protein [Candidatus Parcubacteria bacterium]
MVKINSKYIERKIVMYFFSPILTLVSFLFGLYLIRKYLIVDPSVIVIYLFIFFYFSFKVFVKSVKGFRNYRSGLRGENEVSRRLLTELPSNYKLLSNIVVDQYGDIDLVVIGPTGISAIEIKNYLGRFRNLSGKIYKKNNQFDEKILKKIKIKALKINKILSANLKKNYWVKATVVLSSVHGVYSDDLFRGIERDNVLVVQAKYLAKILQEQKGKLSPEEVGAIYKTIKRCRNVE